MTTPTSPPSTHDTTVNEIDQLFKVHQPFIQLSTEARELYLDRYEIPRITTPTALEFYRDYVSRNRPVIITDALNDWPAMHLWKKRNYLREKLANEVVTIDRVPISSDGKGKGDSVVNGEYFVTPHEEQMKFTEFLDQLEAKEKDPAAGVLYCQHQNSSLTVEFASLCEDVPELSFATNAFNASPDAVNLWVGEDRSVSTLHHDPYENLYAVVQGTKQFLLYPPSDYHWLDKRSYPKAKWSYDPQATTSIETADATSSSASSSSSPTTTSTSTVSRFFLIPDPDETMTAWFDLEPQGPDGCLPKASTVVPTSPPLPLRVSPNSPISALPPPGPFPSYDTHPPMPPELRAEYSNPLWVEVEAGEVLYLPSLWFHRVSQTGDAATGRTIAVNFWYDMAYDSRYTGFRFLEQISNAARDQIAAAAASSATSSGSTQKDVPAERLVGIEPNPGPINQSFSTSAVSHWLLSRAHFLRRFNSSFVTYQSSIRLRTISNKTYLRTLSTSAPLLNERNSPFVSSPSNPTPSASSSTLSPSSPFRILVLGGYGLFGARLASGLLLQPSSSNLPLPQVYLNARHPYPDVHRDILKRVQEKSTRTVTPVQLDSLLQTTLFDARGKGELASQLSKLQINVVVNCVGPFQSADYSIPTICAEAGVHYIDLADAREFVCKFTSILDSLAKKHNVTLISGASSVPGLSSAAVRLLMKEMNLTKVLKIDAGISPGNHTPRGLATMQSILTQTGHGMKWRQGNQDVTVPVWSFGNTIRAPKNFFSPKMRTPRRWLSAIDIPDLELFPTHFASTSTSSPSTLVPSVGFRAGLEVSLMHLGLVFLSHLVQFGWIKNLAPYASFLKRLVDQPAILQLGSDTGGMFVMVEGESGQNTNPSVRRGVWRLYAGSGEGLQIPATAAVVLCSKLQQQHQQNQLNRSLSEASATTTATGATSKSPSSSPLPIGAYPCLSLFTVDEFMEQLKPYDIHHDWIELTTEHKEIQKA